MTVENDLTASGLQVSCCRTRQARLIAHLDKQGIDVAIFPDAASIQWLTGARLSPLFSPCVAIDSQREVVLVVPENQQGQHYAADRVELYEAQWRSTLRMDQPRESVKVLFAALDRPPLESPPSQPVGFLSDGKEADLGLVVAELRRQKEADELQLLKRANEANEAMYARARQLLDDGARNELEIYAELHKTAVLELGETLTYFGQDFQSCSRGGPPRDRDAQNGELMIFDLGVGYRGYYSDNARTFAVGGDPTPAQMQAWKACADVFEIIQAEVRPGVRCQHIYERIYTFLNAQNIGIFDHHLGHGVGLFPHEYPHLNPHWDDTFEPGDFFTVEPGLYTDELRAGVRLEQNYLVTDQGTELLTPFELGPIP